MQSRLRNYNHDLASFEHNLMNLGLHNPGRYAGFDTMIQSGTLTIDIGHDDTGIGYKTAADTIKGPLGVLLSGQGVIIMEDTPIEGLTIDTNAGNSEFRYDLIICTHSFVNVTGGQDAVYSVVKGPINSPIKPILSDSYKQIPIGVLEIPPGATDANQFTYKKFKCPDSGDGEDARLSDPNIFKALQLFNKSAIPLIIPTETFMGPQISHLWSFDSDGNTLEILPDLGGQTYYLDGLKIQDIPLQEGIQIKVIINEKVTVRNIVTTIPSPYDGKGYRALKTHSTFFDTTNGSVSSFTPGSGELWILDLLFIGGAWVVENIGGKTNNTKFSTGDIIEWFGDIAANFDNTGKGLAGKPKQGWQICNGLLGTPDKRGYIPRGATDVPSQGAAAVDPALGTAAVNTFSGGIEKTIAQNNLPDYILPIYQDSHSHTTWTTSRNNEGGNRWGYIPGNAGDNGSNGGYNSTSGYSSINLIVYSGGGNVPLDIMPPTHAAVFIMKL